MIHSDPTVLIDSHRSRQPRKERSGRTGSDRWLASEFTAQQLAQRIRRENLSDRDIADLLYVWGESRHNKAVAEPPDVDMIGRDLLLELDLHTVIGKLLRAMRDLSARDAVALCLSQDVRAQDGPATVYRSINCPAGASFTATKIVSTDVERRGEPARSASICAGCPLLQDGSQCRSFPLQVGATVPLGALCIAVDEPMNPLTTQQLRDLATFAGWAAIAINNAMRLADAECKARAVRAQMVAHLHDNAAQTISLLALKIDQLADRIAREELAAATDQIGAVRSIVHKVGAQLREVLSDSVEPARLKGEFLPELRACAESFTQASSIPVEFLVFDESCPKATVQVQALQIVGEALANIRRHAQAHSVRIEIRRALGNLQIEIRDDGKGFAPDANAGAHHLGMTIMKERARRCGGNLTVESAPGRGTCVRLDLPLAA